MANPTRSIITATTSVAIPLVCAALALVAPPTAAQTPPPEPLSTAVLAYVKTQGETALPRLRHAEVDLNSDGVPDALTLLLGPSWCGSGGCTLLVFKGGSSGFSLIGATSVTLEPIRVAQERRHGWASLVVHSRGRGEVVLRFNGRRYPSNPSRQPVAGAAQVSAARPVIE